MIYTVKGEMLDKMIQDSWEVRQVGCRTGGMHGLEGGRTGGRQDWKEAGMEGCRKGGIHERSDAERRSAGKVRCRTGRMQDRRDSGHV